MRRLFLILPILCCSLVWGQVVVSPQVVKSPNVVVSPGVIPAFGTISIVNNDANAGHVTCSSSGGTCQTPVINTSGATLYVAVLATAAASPTIETLIGNNTNNGTSFDIWTCLTAHHSSAGAYVQICYAQQPTPSPGVIFQLTGSEPSLFVSVWQSTAILAVLDGAGNGNASSSNVLSLTTGSTGTLSTAQDLIISGWTTTGSNITGLAASGLTILDSVGSANGDAGAHADLLASANTAINSTWSVTTTSEDMATAIAAFVPIVTTNPPILINVFTSGVVSSPTSSLTIATNPITTISGDLLACGVVAEYQTAGTAALPTGVADASNTYADMGTHVSVTGNSITLELSIWYKANLTGGSTLTPTATFSADVYGYMICQQYGNMATSSALDSGGIASGTNTSAATSITTGSFTTTHANDVIFAIAGTTIFEAGGTYETFAPGTHFTLRGLDYVVGYTDIWQSAAAEDWYPNAIETAITGSISYNHGSNGAILTAAFEGSH